MVNAPKKEPATLEELEGCFGSPATAAATGKDSIESLLKNNTLLTVKLYTVIIGGAGGDGTKPDKPPRLAKGCPHCKRDTWHDPDDCFELAKNEQ